MIQLFTIYLWLLFRFTTLWETDWGTDQGLTVKGYQADGWSTWHLITWGLSFSTKPLCYKTLGFLLPWNDQQVIVEKQPQMYNLDM